MANDSQTASSPLNPSALSLDSAARLLTKIGGQPIHVRMLAADLADGAPANADGTINLVHYAAWLVREAEANG